MHYVIDAWGGGSSAIYYGWDDIVKGGVLIEPGGNVLVFE